MDEQITPLQFVYLIVCTIMGTSILMLPYFAIREAGQDAWISLLITATLDITVGAMIYVTGLRYPRLTLVQYSLAMAGPVVGRLLSAVYLLFLLHMTALSVRGFGDFVTSSYMPETPLWLLNMAAVLVSVWVQPWRPRPRPWE